MANIYCSYAKSLKITLIYLLYSITSLRDKLYSAARTKDPCKLVKGRQTGQKMELDWKHHYCGHATCPPIFSGWNWSLSLHQWAMQIPGTVMHQVSWLGCRITTAEGPGAALQPQLRPGSGCIYSDSTCWGYSLWIPLEANAHAAAPKIAKLSSLQQQTARGWQGWHIPQPKPKPFMLLGVQNEQPVLQVVWDVKICSSISKLIARASCAL